MQNKNNPYHLPVYTIRGVNYMIYPLDLGEKIWTEANSACENLTAYGFSDWRLPTKEEADLLHGSTDARSNFVSSAWYWTSSWSRMVGDVVTHYYQCRVNSSSTYYSDYITSCDQSLLRYTRPIRILIQ